MKNPENKQCTKPKKRSWLGTSIERPNSFFAGTRCKHMNLNKLLKCHSPGLRIIERTK